MADSPGLLATSGVVPPLVTPLDADGEVDVESMGSLVEHLLAGGVRGLFLLGSTGEATALSPEQRDRAVRAAVEACGHRVPVLVGVIAPGTAQAANFLLHAADCGADGYVATAPFYAATHQAEIARHFELLAKAADGAPLYAYNIPNRVGGTTIEVETLASLAERGCIRGVKDSSGDLAYLRAVLLARQERRLVLEVLSGSELLADLSLLLGADGLVPGLGNIDPAGYVRIVDYVAEGHFDLAQREQERLFRLFEITTVAEGPRSEGASALGAFKAALAILGVIRCDTLAPPLVALTESHREQIRSKLVEAGLVDWR